MSEIRSVAPPNDALIVNPPGVPGLRASWVAAAIIGLSLAALSPLSAVAGAAGQTPVPAASSHRVFWTDWTAGTTGNNGSAKGTMKIGTTTVNVSYKGEIGFIQTGSGVNYYKPEEPYKSGLVDNAPPPSEMIALSQAAEKTLTFDHPIDNLFFAVVSLNGNGYGFDQDFEIVSTGKGYWGNGTLAKKDLGNGKYMLIGTGEPHGVIRFTGSVSSITWASLTKEYWNGFTVGTYGLAKDPRTGSIQVESRLPRTKKPSKNLEIILDASGSMKLALGKKTRWTTALDVLKEVVAKLPDDFNVGLRIYGHRESSKSPKTCTDSELVLPIARLNREQVLAAANRVKPRGETPLVYSVLQAPVDLKGSDAGTVIVITDGEESCKGDPVAAAQQLKASGVEATLHIVGFTLTGKEVQAQLATLAESTGGRYYEAQSGEALARALLIAADEKFPYTIFDASGRQVAKGEAGASPAELPPGDYKVVVSAADQELTAGPLTVATGSSIVVRVVLKGDRFALER